jgi:hypothetical protein
MPFEHSFIRLFFISASSRYSFGSTDGFDVTVLVSVTVT